MNFLKNMRTSSSDFYETGKLLAIPYNVKISSLNAKYMTSPTLQIPVPKDAKYIICAA